MFRSILLINAFLLACTTMSTLDAEDKPSAIRIGYPGVGVGGKPHIPGSLCASVKNKHLLEDEFRPDGIAVEWSLNKGAGPAVNELFAAGQLNVAYLGDLAAIIGRSGGIRTTVVLAGGRGGHLYLAVPADSPARSIADLKGKRLSVFKGTALQLLSARLLALQGLSEADFRSIALEHSAGLAALLNHDIDGLWAQFPVLEYRDKGDVRILASSRDALPPGSTARRPTNFGVVVVGDAFLKNHPDLVQRLVNVLVRESSWVSDPANREELLNIWALSGYPKEAFRAEIGDDDLKKRLSPLLDGDFLAEIKEGLKSAEAFKLIRKPIDLPAWIDDRFLKEALRTLKLEQHWTAYDEQAKPAPAAAP